MHLIDTSVWIDFLRGSTTSKVSFLEQLLTDGEAALCEVTYSEICFGAKDQKQLLKYSKYFGAIPFLSLPLEWHHQAADIGWQIRSKGQKPYLADLMIALTALTHQVPLLTNDKDFEIYQKLFELQLI